ncbi:MAG: FtsX-like permease family protein [Gammaproteobacteria bacterium]|nr:FtsX-like permease family protein [Gammaproteobacteria bacterium]
MKAHTLLTMSLRALSRDWRAGELRVLTAALIVAVASVAAVGFFTDRIRIAMESKASELLGADLVIVSSEPISENLLHEARQRGLQTASSLSFRSVVLAGDETALAEIKAVSPGYPLRGTLETSDRLFVPGQPTDSIPGRGGVWSDERLLQLLKRQVGDSLNLGASLLKVERVLTYEPDRGGDLFSIAPRLLVNLDDIPATELVQPGSRVRYRLLLAGAPERIASYQLWAQKHLQPGEELQDVRDARPELRAALDRAQRFLGLAALVSVILAGIAIAIATRRFASRHWDGVAIMRCVGATQATVLLLFGLEMLTLGLFAGGIGLLVGYTAQQGLSLILSGLMGGDAGLPSPSLWPVWPALATGLLTLLGFGLPPLMRLRDVSPLRVLRRDVSPLEQRAVMLYGPAIVVVTALLVWQAGDALLAWYVLGGVFGTLVILGGAALGLVKGLALLRGRAGVAWRFGLANLSRRGAGSAVQVVALGLGIMVLLVLSLVRNDLLASWQATLPADAPNHFLINIQPEEVAGVRTFLNSHGLADTALYPMVRGRLMAINERPVSPDDYENPRSKRLVEREFNLSWTDRLQEDNRIVAGRWWQPADRGQAVVSVEQGIAERLGIKLHDSLRFRIAGQELEARVNSLRTVEWDSFRANFFVLFPSGVLENYPATWMTSFYIPPARKPVLADLVRSYPSITIVDVDAIMSKVREIMSRVAMAVQYVFLFTLSAGLVVLYAAIQATQDERLFESAILRTLGASKAVILKSLIAEFATLGLLAGVLAAMAASVLGYVLAEYLFDFPYRFDAWIWLLGASAGLFGIGLAGLWGTRTVLDRPPLQSLRES